ncbi:hypothetical protein GcC1_118007 [Golovinomyces cichoracearum]|uniref:Uncharacterized protein n=1 Tax=Golovinomyces cichoracearum TaxID=62708 RepID=A0A420I7J4_9PEZI|nr:hypothetical protein GcC1_118007 [Golovinomyces cichoracearum]
MQFSSIALVFLGFFTSLVFSVPSSNAPWTPRRRQEGGGYGSPSPTDEYPSPEYPCPSGTGGYPAPTGTAGYPAPTDGYDNALKFKRYNFKN